MSQTKSARPTSVGGATDPVEQQTIQNTRATGSTAGGHRGVPSFAAKSQRPSPAVAIYWKTDARY